MTDGPHTDLLLVTRLRAGDDRAFDALYDRHRAPLLRYAERILGPARRRDAEDAVQEAFLRAHRMLTATDRPVALGAWLYTVVRNLCIDELRRPVLMLDPDASIYAFAGAPVADPVDEVAARRQALREVVSDVAALPEGQRDAIVTHVFAGASHAELAARTHRSVGASKSLLNRARTSLATTRRSRDAHPAAA